MELEDVVIVHDYLTQRGGAERVVLAMLRAIPEARLITSVYKPDATFPEFKDYPLEPLWLNSLPLAKRDVRYSLPLLPLAFSLRTIRHAQVVLCSSSGWAHGIQATAPKVVYCHNPPRWLYQSHEYMRGQPRVAKFALSMLHPALRRWDLRAASSADQYLANSTSVRDRIKAHYGIDAHIMHPPVAIDVAGHQEALPQADPGNYWLTVSRPRGYKNAGPICEAVERRSRDQLLIVGNPPTAPHGTKWSDRIIDVQGITDAQLRWAYANCRGLIAASYEDFGLTPVEANAFGKPVVALRAGGYLDTVREGVNGVFFEDIEPHMIGRALDRIVESPPDTAGILRHADNFSENAFARRLRNIVKEVALRASR